MVKYRNTEPIVTTNMVLAGKLEVEAASGKWYRKILSRAEGLCE
jgi:hypothetical protein